MRLIVSCPPGLQSVQWILLGTSLAVWVACYAVAIAVKLTGVCLVFLCPKLNSDCLIWFDFVSREQSESFLRAK